MRRLGIVIPAYNVAFPLKRALQQIEEQLTDDVAVVVVDDVVGFAFDQVEVGRMGGGEVGVDVPEEGREEEERGALRDGIELGL